MSRHQIPVAMMEFDEGGHTIWIHGPQGGTVLRIKATGKILVDRACVNINSHADLIVNGDIEICLVDEPEMETDEPTTAG